MPPTHLVPSSSKAPRYSGSYAIAVATTQEAAHATLTELSELDTPVALVIADRGAGGADLLDAVRDLHPRTASRPAAQLERDPHTPGGDRQAFAHRKAECVVTRPAGVPDERFHRSVTELLDEWWHVHGSPHVSVWMIGDEHSSRVHELADKLQRQDIAYEVHPVESPPRQPS